MGIIREIHGGGKDNGGKNLGGRRKWGRHMLKITRRRVRKRGGHK